MLSVKVTGAQEVERLLSRLGKAVNAKDAQADLLIAVRPMVEAAMANVPLGPPTIHLKENIGAAPVPGQSGKVAVGAFRILKIGEIFYGRFLEFGTVKQSATPWLRPAFDATEGSVISRIVSLLRGRVLAAVKK